MANLQSRLGRGLALAFLSFVASFVYVAVEFAPALAGST